MEDRYMCKVVVDLMLMRNEREVLLSLRKNTGYHDGEYELPGGHVEEGEDLIGAMVRESKEELGISINESDLKIVHTLHHYTKDKINFILTTNSYSGEIRINEPDKCEKLEWFDINNLPDNIMSKAKKQINEINNGIKYSKL